MVYKIAMNNANEKNLNSNLLAKKQKSRINSLLCTSKSPDNKKNIQMHLFLGPSILRLSKSYAIAI